MAVAVPATPPPAMIAFIEVSSQLLNSTPFGREPGRGRRARACAAQTLPDAAAGAGHPTPARRRGAVPPARRTSWPTDPPGALPHQRTGSVRPVVHDRFHRRHLLPA